MKGPYHLLMAVVIGIMTGLCAVIFNVTLDFLVELTSLLIAKWQGARLIFPILAALISSVLFSVFIGDKGVGFGVPQVLVEIRFLNVQILKPLGVLWRVISSLVTLCCGLTAGRFGPIVHMGAAIGSAIGYRFKFEDADLKLAIGLGVVGAITTVFGMPLFAVVFTLEVIFRESTFQYLGPLLLTAWMAKQVGNSLGIVEPLLGVWQTSAYPNSWENFRLCILLAICCGLFAVAYILSIEMIGTWFQRWPRRWMRLVMAACIVGIIAFLFPVQMVLHEATFRHLLSGDLSLAIVLLFPILHTLTAGLTLGSGFIGGNFFPGLTIGAALGTGLFRVYSTWISPLAVTGMSHLGILGVVGMLSGYLNAPIASTILAMELVGSTDMILPALLVAGMSRSIVVGLLGRDIFTKTVSRISAAVKQQLSY